LLPDDLRQHHTITFSGLDHEGRWAFQVAGAQHHVPVRSRLTVNTAEAAIDAAVAGLGVTRVLSYQIAAAQRAGLLVTVLQSFEPSVLPISLVFDGQGARPAKLRAFLDMAPALLRQSLSLAVATGE
jgi:DNA-binding transcriptional LysR family regulator